MKRRGLFSKMGHAIVSHRRAMQAGQAMATWSWGLGYTRREELDGFIPDESIKLAWVGEKQARLDADKLVKVGLWEVVPGGWRMLKYELHNETCEEIRTRRLDTAQRVALHRGSFVTRYSDVTAPPGNTVMTRVTNAAVPDSDSDSDSDGSVRESAEREMDAILRSEAELEVSMRKETARGGQVTVTDPVTGAFAVITPDPPKPPRGKQLPEGWKPSPELAQQCTRLAGEDCLTLVPAFTDHHRSRGSVMRDWDAAFRTWSRNHKRFAARSGARVVQRSPETGPAYDEGDGDLPEGFK